MKSVTDSDSISLACLLSLATDSGQPASDSDALTGKWQLTLAV